MDIILTNGKLIQNKSPAFDFTGYKASMIMMVKGDFEELLNLSRTSPDRFNIVMKQLESRFK